jgi:hypothetical protein
MPIALRPAVHAGIRPEGPHGMPHRTQSNVRGHEAWTDGGGRLRILDLAIDGEILRAHQRLEQVVTSSWSARNSRTWQMPGRRHIRTGGNTTRSGLTAQWDMRRRRSSSLKATDKGSLDILTCECIVLFRVSLRDSYFKWTNKRGAAHQPRGFEDGAGLEDRRSLLKRRYDAHSETSNRSSTWKKRDCSPNPTTALHRSYCLPVGMRTFDAPRRRSCQVRSSGRKASHRAFPHRSLEGD